MKKIKDIINDKQKEKEMQKELAKEKELEELDKLLIEHIQPQLTNKEIDVNMLKQPYTVTHLALDDLGRKAVYVRAQCDAATGCSYKEYVARGEKFDPIMFSFLNGDVRICVDLPNYSDFPGELKLSQKGMGQLNELLVKKLGEPTDEYIADTLIRKRNEHDVAALKKMGDARLPDRSDYLIDFSTDKIVSQSMRHEGHTQEVQFDLTGRELNLMLARSCMAYNLRDENGEMPKVTAAVTYNWKTVAGFKVDDFKYDIKISGKQFDQPVSVPVTAEEKLQISNSIAEFGKSEHNTAKQKTEKNSAGNKPFSNR